MVKVSGIRPGDLVAHHSECIHMAGNNRSDDRTRVGYPHKQIQLKQALLTVNLLVFAIVIAGKKVRDPGLYVLCVYALAHVRSRSRVRAWCLSVFSSEHLRACFEESTRYLMRRDTQDI